MFQNLFKLYYRKGEAKNLPLEDFNTEVFAGLLRLSPELFREYLILLDLPDDSYLIKTQEFYYSEESEKCFPDMVLIGDENVCFIENKINSREGKDQLERYCDVLEFHHSDKETHLVYCTKFTDPKDILRCNFKQIHWHEISEIIRGFPEDPYLMNYYKFLKANNMVYKNTFTPEMIVGMENMKEITGAIWTHLNNAQPFFKKTFNRKGSPRREIDDPVKDRMGYMVTDILSGEKGHSELMYFIRVSKVKLETHIYVNNVNSKLEMLRDKIEDFKQNEEGIKLVFKYHPRGGYVISCDREIYDLINDPKADEKIQKWFEDSFQVFARFIRETPDLEWTIGGGEIDS